MVICWSSGCPNVVRKSVVPAIDIVKICNDEISITTNNATGYICSLPFIVVKSVGGYAVWS